MPRYAVINEKGTILRFENEAPNRLAEGERSLPVEADPDPDCPDDCELWGPEYEVQKDRVRAYSRVMPMPREAVLERKIARVTELESRLAAVEAKG